MEVNRNSRSNRFSVGGKGRADAKADEALAAKHKADRLTYLAHMNLAQAAWEDARVARLLELLGEHEPKAGETDLRGFEWHYRNHLAHSY